jgi:hypothetical protein
MDCCHASYRTRLERGCCGWAWLLKLISKNDVVHYMTLYDVVHYMLIYLNYRQLSCLIYFFKQLQVKNRLVERYSFSLLLVTLSGSENEFTSGVHMNLYSTNGKATERLVEMETQLTNVCTVKRDNQATCPVVLQWSSIFCQHVLWMPPAISSEHRPCPLCTSDLASYNRI